MTVLVGVNVKPVPMGVVLAFEKLAPVQLVPLVFTNDLAQDCQCGSRSVRMRSFLAYRASV